MYKIIQAISKHLHKHSITHRIGYKDKQRGYIIIENQLAIKITPNQINIYRTDHNPIKIHLADPDLFQKILKLLQ
jgi:hypothetical protein